MSRHSSRRGRTASISQSPGCVGATLMPRHRCVTTAAGAAGPHQTHNHLAHPYLSK
ncbi:hypothetical protein BDR04DRAFT_233839 [Suillus decipiens]|nr:hypothetical protein BDR04DRAFT_233839 [Suillus decipiens]